MAESLKLCSTDPALAKKIADFRKRKEKDNAAIIIKVNTEEHTIIEDDDCSEELADYENPTIEDVASVLPAHQPRFVAYSYVQNHDDGRVSFPQCFIFCSPIGCKTQMQMLYAGSKLHLVKESGFTKVFEVRNSEELTEEWLKSKLAFFR